MSKMGEYELKEEEKEEVKKMVSETTAIYKFIDDNRLFKDWMHDSERFMGFTFIHTKALVKHSIALTKLTCWLRGLTLAIVILSIVHIFLILNNIFKWFWLW